MAVSDDGHKLLVSGSSALSFFHVEGKSALVRWLAAAKALLHALALARRNYVRFTAASIGEMLADETELF